MPKDPLKSPSNGVDGKIVKRVIKYIKDKHENLDRGKTIMINCPIEAIFGYQEGSPLDFSAYESVGMRHPKRPDYYGLKYSDPLDIKSENAKDDDFARIFKMIDHGKDLTPILIFVHDDERILALDGATRVSIVSYIRHRERARLEGKDPSLFATIPAKVFLGSEHEAMAEMVAQNAPGRNRSLKWEEMITQLTKQYRAGHDVGLIMANLGIPDTIGNKEKIKSLCEFSGKACPELMGAWQKGRIALTTAIQLAMDHPKASEQRNVLKAMLSARKGNSATISSQTYQMIRNKNIVDCISALRKLQKAYGELRTLVAEAEIASLVNFDQMEIEVDKADNILNAEANKYDEEMAKQREEEEKETDYSDLDLDMDIDSVDDINGDRRANSDMINELMDGDEPDSGHAENDKHLEKTH